jgi:hypothetical protein
MNLKEKAISLAGLGLVFGTAFGYVVGSALGYAGLGIALGSALGLLFAPTIQRKEKASKRN